MSRNIQVALRWPKNWPRAVNHESANFSGDRSLSRSVRTLSDEVRRIKGVIPSSIVITCGDASDSDPGAAVYFTSKAAGPLVLACDKWAHTAHNVWALSCHVKAIRSQERWGVGTAQQTWAGFAQLPPSDRACAHEYRVSLVDATLLICEKCGDRARNPKATGAHVNNVHGKKTWRSILGFPPGSKPSVDAIADAHNRLIRAHHPDAGGSHTAAAEINNARDDAMRAIGEE